MGKKITFCGLVVDIPDPVFVVNGRLCSPATTAVRNLRPMKEEASCRFCKGDADSCVHKVPRAGIRLLVDTKHYDSLDEAAMAAANIIICRAFKNGDGTIEHSIGIYECVLKDHINFGKFCLTETRLGSDIEVGINDSVSLDINGREIKYTYSFKADVHSHPKNNILGVATADYYASCGFIIKGNNYTLSERNSPYVMYLVEVQQDQNIPERKTLTKFTPPTMPNGSYNKDAAKRLAVIMAAVFPRNNIKFSDTDKDAALFIMGVLNTVSYSNKKTSDAALERLLEPYIYSRTPFIMYSFNALGNRLRAERYIEKYDIIERYGGELKKMAIISESRDIEEKEWEYIVPRNNAWRKR